MLGVSNSRVANSILPRYDEDVSTAEIYHETAIKLLLSHEDAEFVFPHAGIREPNTKPGLPTWAPDWEYETGKHCQLLSRHPLPGMQKVQDLQGLNVTTDSLSTLTDSRYAAGGGADVKPKFEVDGSRTKLSTRAVLVDEVQNTTQPYDDLILHDLYHASWILSAQVRSQGVNDGETALARTLIADRRVDTPDFRGGDAGSLLKAYRAFCDSLFTSSLDASSFAQPQSVLGPDAQVEAATGAEALILALGYASQFKTSCGGRRLCVTTSGRLALVPEAARAGDVFAVIPGLQTPYVLRLWRDEAGEREYQLVGECYLDGVMNGEVDLGGVEPVILV